MALIDEVSHCQARQGEDHPHVDTEVIHREAHGLIDGLSAERLGILHRHIKDVVQRLRYTEEHQHRTNSAGKSMANQLTVECSGCSPSPPRRMRPK